MTEIIDPSGRAPESTDTAPQIEAPPDHSSSKFNILKRSFGITMNDTFISSTYYNDGRGIGLVGWYGKTPFSSTDELIRLGGFTRAQQDELIEKAKKYLNT